MQFTNGCLIKSWHTDAQALFSSGTNDNVPQYFLEVYKAYLSYRQCYSRDLKHQTVNQVLCDENKISDLQVEDLYAQYLWWQAKVSHVKQLLEYTEDAVHWHDSARVDLNKDKSWYAFLRMCWFIYQHANHQSPLEHINIQFQYRNMSRACQQQLTRHRLASHSIQSQRYVSFMKEGNTDDAVFFIPPTIARHPEAKELYTQYLEQLPKVVQSIRNLGFKDIKEEDLRYLYPNALTGDGIVTMNLRSWMHFLNERCCSHAQLEIRNFAYDVMRHLRWTLPFIGALLGPKCFALGHCPETKRCGVIRTKFEFQPVVRSDEEIRQLLGTAQD